jgi:hypothetical protein
LSSLNNKIEFGVAELGGGIEVVVEVVGTDVDEGDVVLDTNVLTAIVVDVPTSHCSS